MPSRHICGTVMCLCVTPNMPKETYKRDLHHLQKHMTREKCFLDIYVVPWCVFVSRQICQKRPIKETYKRDLQKHMTREKCHLDIDVVPWCACAARQTCQKRPMYRKRPAKRPTKAYDTREMLSRHICHTVVCRCVTPNMPKETYVYISKETYKRDPPKRPIKETCESNPQKQIKYAKRDLCIYIERDI